MFPWKNIIQSSFSSQAPIYLQISNAVIKQISQGRLAPGQKMPGSRKMAALLNLNRKTVIMAYDELMAQAWIEIIPSRGTYISHNLPVSRQQNLGKKEEKERTFKISITKNKIINTYSPTPKYLHRLDDGSPDVRLAPMDLLLKRCRSISKSSYGKRFLRYANVQGELSLRKELAKYLRGTRGIQCQAENIVTTRGSQMAIYLTINVLLNTGDTALISKPGYLSAKWVIQNTAANLVEIPIDQDGIITDEIEKTCQNQKVRLLYITPHHHFPTTVTLSAQRRLKLLALAEKYGFIILEDDYDYDFHYHSAPILPLASVYKEGPVIYSGSFSKLLAPSVRLGYLVAPIHVVAEINKLRHILDRQGDPVQERAIAQMLSEGEIQRHLKKVVKTYKQRRDYFCNALQTELVNHLTFKIPEGGMAVWAKVLHKQNEQKFSEQLLQKGLYLNMDKHYLSDYDALRMGFASINEKEMDQIVEVLKKIFEQKKA